MTFTSTEQALDACEAAGLQPLVGPDHTAGAKYSICPPGCFTYISCYGDAQFLGWCNYYFAEATAVD